MARRGQDRPATLPAPWLVLLLQIGLIPVAWSDGDASCPCIDSFDGRYTHTVAAAGTINVLLGGQTYTYPDTYGLTDCAAHDSGRVPYCNGPEPPEWCGNSWCYVDTTNCNYVAQSSSYFPGLRYSYQTCGASNTFENWFGANAAAGGAHQLTDIADVMEGYLHSIANAMEANYWEISTGSSSCALPDACSCPSCISNAVWQQDIDVQTSTFWQRPGSSSADTLRVDKCLAAFVSDSFTRIAAKEANVSKIGYAYAGSQANGNYVQWPGTDWCPSDYDPRFRPWYAAAASGPKDVVIVLDTSGSMRGGPDQMARDAAKRVLDTLTDADYVNIVGFSHNAFSYAATLQQATASTLEAMKSWVDESIGAYGGTNYHSAFSKVWQIFGDSSSATSNCNRVVLFLSDGKPESWVESDFSSLATSAAAVANVHILTYALGSAVDAAILKRIACENSGVAYEVTQTNQLADTMASYYRVISPMQPCQTRWISYTDVISGTTLMAGCLAAFQPASPGNPTSCQGGFSGYGDDGDARVPNLLGVSCLDLNMLVSLDVIRARADWDSFYNRLQSERTSCSIYGLNEDQIETIRASISPRAVCDGWSYAASSSRSTVVDGYSDGDTEEDGASVTIFVVVSAAAVALLVAILVCLRKQKPSSAAQPAPRRSRAPRNERAAVPGPSAPPPPPYEQPQQPQVIIAQAVPVASHVPTATTTTVMAHPAHGP